MTAVGFDPNITISGVLVAIPATIAAVAALRNGSRTKKLHTELASPNGTTTAQAIQDIKHTVLKVEADVLEVRSTQASHDLLDIERFGVVGQRQDDTDAAIEGLKSTLKDGQTPQD